MKKIVCLVGIVIPLTLSSCDRNGSATAPNPDPTPAEVRITDARLTPLVAREGETFTLELRIEGTSLPVLYGALGMSPASVLSRDGEPLRDLILRDDGTDGDRTAGDGWYTVDRLAVPPDPSGISGNALTRLALRGVPVGPDLTDQVHRVIVPFRTIDPARIDTPAVMDVAEGLRASSRVVSIAIPNSGYLPSRFSEVAVRRYYQHFPDDRDFLVLSHHVSLGVNPGAVAVQIRNDVGGLGLDVRDFRDWGSPARLSLVPRFSASFHSTGDGFCLLAHELTHQWMAYMGPPLEEDFHWSSALHDRPTTSFSPVGTCVMNDLESYMAGFLPPDSVASPLTADGYDLEDLITDHGPRFPAYPEAPTEFTIAFLVVGERTLEDHEFAYFHHLAREYVAAESPLGVTWQETTRGRSTLDGILPLPGERDSGANTAPPPGGVDGEPTQ